MNKNPSGLCVDIWKNTVKFFELQVQ